MVGNTKLKLIPGPTTMSDSSDNKYFNEKFDVVFQKLSSIEGKVDIVGRLEERVNNHEKSITEHQNKLNDHTTQLTNAAIENASRISLTKDVEVTQARLSTIELRIKDLEKTRDTQSGIDSKSDSITNYAIIVFASLLSGGAVALFSKIT